MRRTWAPDCICNCVTLGALWIFWFSSKTGNHGVSGSCDDGQGPIRVLCGSWYVLSVLMFMDTGCAKAWLYTQSTNFSFVSLLKHRETSRTPTLCMPVKSWEGRSSVASLFWAWPLLKLHHPEHSLYVACRNSISFPIDSNLLLSVEVVVEEAAVCV